METIENPDLLSINDIRAYRDHLQQNGYSFDQSDLRKSSARAAKHRCDGNLLYAKKEYVGALQKYNESICSAPNDSEDLGIGYANRSAVFCTMGNHTLALANIALAKEHNYPERLMSKLMAREANVKQAMKDNSNAFMPSGLDLNPFISDEVCVRKLPVYNNSMVARWAIKAGDAILQERPLMVAIDEPDIFVSCNHCGSENLRHLIPCRNCVSAMFCTEKCLQDGQAMHRFECGITGELSKLSDAWIGARMFFHGLALFDGDVNKMMKFCRTVKVTGNTFQDLDYSNYDPMKEFKIFVAVKPADNGILRYAAAIVHALLLTVSSVRALITNRAQEDFMLQCFAEYAQKAATMTIKRAPCSGMVSVLYPVASLCNHSCDPNTLVLDYGGQLKLIAIRPIRPGEQIFVSYGAHYEQGASERQLGLAALRFNCICEVCDVRKRRQWMAKARQGMEIAPKDRVVICKMIHDTDGMVATTSKLMNTAVGDFIAINKLLADIGDRIKTMQQFIQRYASIHPRMDYASILKMYCGHLTVEYCAEMNSVIQARTAG